MKKKNLISLTVALTFLGLSITGLLLYLKQKSHTTEIIHTLFGLIFIGFAIFHIINNWSSIASYTKEQAKFKIRKEFWVAFIIAAIFLIGASFDIPPFESIAEAGRIFAPKRDRRPFDREKPPMPSQVKVDSVATKTK